MDFRACQQHWWGCKQLWCTLIICMFTCYSCISKCLLLVIHSLLHYLKMVGCILSVWSAINVCGFCSRHRLMEKEGRWKGERGRSASFIWRRERGGGNGLGEGTEHAWESSSVALWTEGYCPGNLSEWLPWGPLPLSLPHLLSLSHTFSPHSLFFLDRFSTFSVLPNRNCSLSRLTISQSAFHATQTHIPVSLSALCLWPPSRRSLNSMHYVISVGCVHTAVRCRITMPWRDGALNEHITTLTDVYLIRLQQQQCLSACVRLDGIFAVKFGSRCRRQFVCCFHF